MRQFFLKTVVNGIPLWVAALVVPGIAIGSQADGLGTRLLSVVLVALLFGVINTLVKPLVKLFSFPLIILSLGLFTFIINAAMLSLLSWASGALGLDFHVDSFFWSAVLGAVVVTFVAMLLNLLLPDGEDDRVVLAGGQHRRY
ncbi:phage holin family protein [Kytococcus sedentarius]|uniref:Predicted membrane protein n=1 Tax=Kytococcus sedentarius (strain ATCC 14392 / DSM 20547 / JCM 11482 / CCUG 33030 / NBRC 15357 / NCTC 11040 / CCM 314 / 541) TaxID=478801 RepID=C7NJI8_KYTSD|nr:phage holin family protein [Kytococcus sedentarius]ACV05318.1 predicted membrane protein [Kytococcus sedentarius DSM 20547]QQB63770.1 phage holin family protein [Kytococcus sedentarius]STX13272.1 Membrane protein of uncharacterised function [Kytococcus sedentarius]